MTIWGVASVEREPEINLSQWQIMETDKGERHFVGYNNAGMEGRVSSVIETFDPEKRLGVTRSGRVYQLQGEPGVNLDAWYVWDWWRDFNAVQNFRDVTSEALAGD